jgi:hypothetical protein
VHDFGNPGGTGKWDFYGRDMETYTPMVDVMGHPHLGEKTVLYLVDAFYTVRRQNFDVTIEDKWQMEPFNGDWPSSLLLSLDGVAIESVGLDFLRSEPTQFNVTGNVDNYLHEAAEAAAPSSGTFYDPDGDNIALSSLGVHEHWNNEIDKQYSRNLGTGEGIELVMAEKQVINDINMLANHTIQFSIIGNPVSNKLMVELSNHTGRITCQVIDLGGKTVRSKDFRIHGQNEKVQLDVSDLEQGIYILNVISEKGYRKAEKFIKD